jgi:hypothetical protein
MDVTANVTLVNLVFSTKNIKFNFSNNDINFDKIESLVITNYGSTITKFKIISPNNKSFVVLSNK